MTVSTETNHNEYTGNGVTTSFPYTFRIFKKSDLVVFITSGDDGEDITTLRLDTDYTVTGAGGFRGGNVILKSTLAKGVQISISRELPATQETDLRNQGKFFPEVHEDAFDRLTMLIQQIRSSFSLALRKPSFLANYYDAMGNYIRNLRDPSRPQDAANKRYVDNQISGNTEGWQEADRNLNEKIDGNNRRTVRATDFDINPLPPAEDRAGKVPSFDRDGQLIVVAPASGSAVDVLNQLAGSGGFGLIGQVESVAHLLVLPGNHGDRVLLESYYGDWKASEGKPLGGGEFYFDSSKKEINNGVTIFNGWIRKPVGKAITTHDAGLVSLDGSNATLKLQSIVDEIGTYSEVIIYGEHFVNSRIHLIGKSGFKITGVDAKINAKALSQSWTFQEPSKNFSEGIIHLESCKHFEIKGLEINGAKKPNFAMAGYQSGDSGIWGIDCHDFDVHHNHIHDVRAWGVVFYNSNDGQVHDNTIHDCVKQSAINATNGGSNVRIYDNTLYNCGLYGVENELPGYSGDNSKDIYTYGNAIFNCKYGIYHGVLNTGRTYDNTVTKCSIGIAVFSCFSGASYNATELIEEQRILVKDNDIFDCATSVSVQGSTNVSIIANTTAIQDYPKSFIYDQYVTVDELVDGNALKFRYASFIIGGSPSMPPVGRVIYIRGFKYTVTAVSALLGRQEYGYPKEYATAACMVEVTLDSALDPSITISDFVKWMEHGNIATQTSGIEVRTRNGVTSSGTVPVTCDGLVVEDNDIRDVGRGLYLPFSPYPNSVKDIRQLYIKNTFKNVSTWVTGFGYGMTLIGNEVSPDNGKFFNKSGFIAGDTSDYLKNITPAEKVVINLGELLSGQSAYYYQTFSLQRVRTLFACHLRFAGNVSTTGDIIVRINTSDNLIFTVPIAEFIANTMTNKYFSSYKVVSSQMWSGNYRVDVHGSDNSLVCKSLQLELWFI